MANVKKVYNDLIIINLYLLSNSKIAQFSISATSISRLTFFKIISSKCVYLGMVQILQFEWSFLRDPYKQIRFAKQGRNTQFW